MNINDPNGNSLAVTSDGRAKASARSTSRMYYASRDRGDAYSAVAIDAGPVAAEFTIYLKNTSLTKNLVVEEVITSNVNADVIWKLHLVTGVATGTDIVPVNANLASTNLAPATCKGGATGVGVIVSSSVIATWMGGNVYSSASYKTGDALIVGANQGIAVEYDAGTGGACAITIKFYYEEQ